MGLCWIGLHHLMAMYEHPCFFKYVSITPCLVCLLAAPQLLNNDQGRQLVRWRNW
jgi:hypothetical protein